MAAHLGLNPDAAICSLGYDLAPRGHRAGERHGVDVVEDRPAGFGITRHHPKNVGGQYVGQRLGEAQRARGRLGRWLEKYRVAVCQG